MANMVDGGWVKLYRELKSKSILFDSNNENDNWKLNTSVFNLAVIKSGTKGCANYHFITCQS